jgi:hypothetical protein
VVIGEVPVCPVDGVVIGVVGDGVIGVVAGVPVIGLVGAAAVS